jgi:ketosteroid isomerase-like protein
MSQEKVKVAQRFYEMLAELGMDERAVRALAEAGVVADEVELDMRTGYPDGQLWGFKEVGSFLDSQPWGRSLRFDAESFKVADDGRVLVFVRAHGVGAGSGLEVEGRNAHLLTFRGNRVVRIAVYTDRGEALQAAGLSE